MTAPVDETDKEQEESTEPLEDAALEDEALEEDGDAGEEEEEEGKKKDPKKLIKLIAVGVVAFLLIGGTTAYFMGWVHAVLGIEQAKKVALLQLGKPVNFELPQIKADLKTGECRAPFLRARFNVQLSSEDVKRLEESQDKLMEQVILHLRDQERQDLVGKSGADKLRFDLVNIVNNVIAPSRIHGITYKEFVLQ